MNRKTIGKITIAGGLVLFGIGLYAYAKSIPKPKYHMICSKDEVTGIIICKQVEGEGIDECQVAYDCPCETNADCGEGFAWCIYNECLPIGSQEIHWQGSSAHLYFPLKKQGITVIQGIIRMKGGILCPICQEPIYIYANFTDRNGIHHQKTIWHNDSILLNPITETKVYISEMFEPTAIDELEIWAPAGTGYSIIKKVDLAIM